MSSSRLIRRLLRAHPSASPASRFPRVRPPAPWAQADSVWRQLWQWLRDDLDTPPRSQRSLIAARLDCAQALSGLDDPAARDLCQRCEHARSLRELWHLRAEVYSLVARRLSQGEADRRLQAINRHYTSTTVAPRSATPEHPHV